MTRSRVLAAVALVATIVLAAQTWHKAFRPDGYDLTSYLLSARALWSGQSPYGLPTPFPYIYPLFLAFVLIPLTAVPYGAAVIAWFAANVAALAAIVESAVTRRIVESGSSRIQRTSARAADLAMAATVLVAFAVIQNNLLNGQVNLIVVLCCVLAVAAAQKGRETASGAWLGAGIALKLMPAVLVAYLIVRRQFRAVIVGGVSALLFAFVPALLLDGSGGASVFRRIVAIHLQFTDELRTSVAGGPELSYSISGLVQRLSGMSPSLWLDAICAAVVMGALALIDVRVWRPRGQHFAAATAYMAAVVLISPKSETHHLAFAIPAIAVSVAWWFGNCPDATARPSLMLVLAVLGVIVAPFTGAVEGPMIAAATLMLIAELSLIAGERRRSSE